MHIKKRIKLVPYFTLSLLVMVGLWYICIDWNERIGVSIVTLGTFLNHCLLFVSVKLMVDTAVLDEKEQLKKAKKRAIILQIIKLLVLVLALSLSVQLMGNRVIIAGANYFALLMIFAFSVRRGEKE